jgi:hypothetical protein
MAATAFGAHGFAKYQAEARELRMRDYSSPEKWVEPKYASRNDMEAVSLLRTCTEEVGREISASAGLFGDWGHLYRQHSLSVGSVV